MRQQISRFPQFIFTSCRQAMPVFAIFTLLLLSGRLLAQPNIIFCDDFESGTLDPSYWTATPSADGVVEVSNESPYDGALSVKMGKSVDAGGFQTQKLDLHLNLQGHTQVELTFWILDYYDETQIEDGLFFSKDGVNFVPVLAFKPGDWCDNAYGQFPPIDVDELAKAAFGANWATSQFVIRFQQRGTGDFFGSEDGFYIDNVCVYDAPKAYYQVTANHKFTDDFETCSLSDNWAWRFADKTNTLAQNPTRPSNFVGPEHGYGHESECAIAMGKRCDDGSGAFATNALDLHLNLAGQQQVALSFWMLDYYDETQADDGIYFSNDGGTTFQKVLDFKPAETCDNQWGQLPPIDVDELAKAAFGPNWATGQFIIRFQQHDDGDFFGSEDGFFMDDVSVYVPEQEFYPVYTGHAFSDDFETGNFRPMWAWRWADQTNTLAQIPTRASNYVAVESGSGYDNSQYGVAFGKRCDDPSSSFATNALDLYLNLAGQTQVEMSFWMLDYYDKTQADHRLYFSNDGGLNFKKAFDFHPGAWCDNRWGQFPPFDIDELAAKIGLTLTDKFVIRFQQHDDGDFFGSEDGLFMDDVNVYVPDTKYVPVPFFDDFETGDFGPAWSWRFGEQTSPAGLSDVTRLSNIVLVESNSGNNSQYGVTMGKRCDDEANAFVTNSLDLHLNLEGASGVKLRFDLLDYYDETQNADGIYFSKDGGASYKKVLDFDFANFPDNTWASAWPNPAIDVDALALAAFGPDWATRQFIIRFQQHDDGDFFGNEDGILIDNVNVSATNATPVYTPETGESFTIFPNPATESIQIAWSEALPGKEITLRLFDAQGKLVRTETTDSDSKYFSVDLFGIAPGALMLQMVSDIEVWTSKVVKSR